MSNEISWLFSKVYVKLGLRSMVENDNSRSDVLFRIALEFDGKSAGHEAVFRNVLALSQFPLGAIADDDSAAKVLQQGIDIRSFAARLYEVATWSLYVTFRDIRPDYANRMRSILTHDPEFPFAMVDGLFWNTSNVSKEIGTKTRAEVIYDIYSKFSGIMKANGTPIPPRLNVQIFRSRRRPIGAQGLSRGLGRLQRGAKERRYTTTGSCASRSETMGERRGNP